MNNEINTKTEEQYIQEARELSKTYNKVITNKLIIDRYEAIELAGQMERLAHRILNINVTSQLFMAVEEIEIKFDMVQGIINF